MGNTPDATGIPDFDDENDPQADLSALSTALRKVGGLLKVTASERESLTASQTLPGWIISETDTGRVYLRTASNAQGELIGSLPTDPGSVVPTAGAGITLSDNTLYTRSGFLLGSIGWSKTTALGHADIICTLPVGARPIGEYSVDASGVPSPSLLFQVAVTPTGVVSAIQPPGGRTSGTLRFVLPIG